MPYFKAKPVVVEAFFWNGQTPTDFFWSGQAPNDRDKITPFEEFLTERIEDGNLHLFSKDGFEVLKVNLKPNRWLVRNYNGLFMIYTKEDFEIYFEPVEDYDQSKIEFYNRRRKGLS